MGRSGVICTSAEPVCILLFSSYDMEAPEDRDISKRFFQCDLLRLGEESLRSLFLLLDVFLRQYCQDITSRTHIKLIFLPLGIVLIFFLQHSSVRLMVTL